jgi:hypothetical protein
MKRHKLLVYQWLNQRYRTYFLLLWLLLLLLAVYDFTIRPLFADNLWPMVWVALVAAFLLWLYYTLLVRRASVEIQPRVLVIRGPLRTMKISYGRIQSVTSTQLIRHHDPKQHKGPTRTLIEEVGGQTCLHIALHTLPQQYQQRRFWYSPLLFSDINPGLLLVVEDWMALSRQLEVARSEWHQTNKVRRQGDKRSLAARVLDEKPPV